MKRICLVLCALAIGTAAMGAEKNLLTPEPERIIDEAIADDIAVMRNLQGRLAILNDKGVPIGGYHFAKAQAWLDFAMDEYTVNDRSRVVEEALGQALGIIEPLERGDRNLGVTTPIIPTSSLVRPDLWEKAETLKKNVESFRCAGDKIAQLEVQLVWAGHEEKELGWRHAKPYLQAAERLAREVDDRMASCPQQNVEQAQPGAAVAVIPPITDRAVLTPVPPPAAMKCPEPVPAVINAVLEPLPDSVHFALDRAEISDTSAAVLDRIAAAMKKEPDLRILLKGHADQRGEFTYNLTLSRKRVEHVRAYLLAAGVDVKRISIAAFGMTQPLNRTRTADGYARNRRVEFSFTLSPAQPMLHQQDDLQPEKQ
jgi:outer membrane protein OmpA-like peptidoglycan-associated protein